MTNLNQIFNESVVITNNPTILEDITTNIVALEGSEITYTPYENSDFVVYEYDFQLSFNNSDVTNSIYIGGRLQEYNGSSWVDISNTYFSYYSEADSAALPASYRMVLDSWSGSKQIRLAAKAWTDINSRGYRVHNAYYTTSNDSTRKSQAVLTIYSIINGN
tara:strand:- start:662 stop:1147 length:486 start_codon:yes stop_codon:yes gene_type:complete